MTDSAVPLRILSNSVVGLLHRLEMNTSPGDWYSIVKCLLGYQYEHVSMGYPRLFLLRCLQRAVAALVKKDYRWGLAAAVLSKCIGHAWRPWQSMQR